MANKLLWYVVECNAVGGAINTTVHHTLKAAKHYFAGAGVDNQVHGYIERQEWDGSRIAKQNIVTHSEGFKLSASEGLNIRHRITAPCVLFGLIPLRHEASAAM